MSQIFEAVHGTTFVLTDSSQDVQVVAPSACEGFWVPTADLLEFAAEHVRGHRLAQIAGPDAMGSERFRVVEEARLRGAEPHTLLGLERLPEREGSRVEDDPHQAADVIARALVEAWAEAPLDAIIPPVIPEWARKQAFQVLVRLRSTPTMRQLYAFEVVDGMVWTVYFAHSYSDALRHHETHLAAGDLMADAELFVRLLAGDTEFTVESGGTSRTLPVSAWMQERNTPGFFLSGVVEPDDIQQEYDT